MTQEHPIKPPLELVDKWFDDAPQDIDVVGVLEYVATQAARWGADIELKACCEWIPKATPWDAEQLRAARRPNPQGLKQQALEAVGGLEKRCDLQCNLAAIHRALEFLPE